ncbi:MAG: hypothetical protein IPI65_02200 [Bacteroidetes bacterium]|nr:hypothetical protein [Bacteroidota bacterium]
MENGGSTSVATTLDFDYQKMHQSLATGTWTDVNTLDLQVQLLLLQRLHWMEI